jgi:ketopantoate reductase
MKNFRIQPQAVCRTLLANLKTYEPLTPQEEDKIIRAVKTSGVDQAVERLLANLSRNTVEKLLQSM